MLMLDLSTADDALQTLRRVGRLHDRLLDAGRAVANTLSTPLYLSENYCLRDTAGYPPLVGLGWTSLRHVARPLS